ncbi:hypothetical protein KAR91_67605 [Candidatus Pacearchaeota archaeon]|nr:hypothetical protein [Candidatus Pacearchaeota archaeon]
MNVFKWEDKNRAWFSSFSSKGDRLYHYGYDSLGEYICTCPSFHYDTGMIDGKCKHIRESMQTGKVKHMSQYYIKSELDTINKLFYDTRDPKSCGLPVGSLINYRGKSRMNKSILAMQNAMKAGSQLKKNILFLLTEGKDGHFQVEPWLEVFNKRFKTNYGIEHWYFDVASYWFDQVKYEGGKKKGQIKQFSYDLEKYWKKETIHEERQGKLIILRTDSLFTLHLLTGFPCEMVPSEGGKFGMNPHPSWILDSFWKTPLFNIVHENNIGVTVLDSLSAPLKGIFLGDQMKYPARTDAIAAVLIPLDKICANRNIVGITVHHETRDETRPDAAKAFGGNIVEYTHKFELGFFAGDKGKQNQRTLVRVRHPSLAKQAPATAKKKEQFVKINNGGLFDVIE